MSNNKCGNREYSVEFKVQVINHMKKEESTAKLSRALSIATSTLSNWKRNAAEILKSHSGMEPKLAKSTIRIQLSKYPVVDRCLIQWLKNMQSHQHPPPYHMDFL